MRTIRLIGLTMMLVAAAATAASAQVRGMGRVNGVVVDEGGAPIADVVVKTATEAGTVIECKSDANGKWTLGGIGRGDWIISLTKPGFTTKRLKAIVEREID